ncbi:MAG: hypothetical protein IPN70_01550 [Candidatus Moraniibacteriota bacterium]|nr:MAG: hypothetical protein IPN70_01550 [Candidatus Moranbacteria bacterium]
MITTSEMRGREEKKSTENHFKGMPKEEISEEMRTIKLIKAENPNKETLATFSAEFISVLNKSALKEEKLEGKKD